MSLTKNRGWMLVATLCLLVGMVGSSAAQEGRKIKTRVAPVYPELAKRMNVSGIVKLELTIAADGSVKSVKPLGGHPLLIEAAADAAKRSRYEAGPAQTTQVVDYSFKLGG